MKTNLSFQKHSWGLAFQFMGRTFQVWVGPLYLEIRRSNKKEE